MAWKFNPFTSKQDYYQTAPVLPSITIDFDTVDPNTPGTIFTPEDELNTDALYISAVNNSQWTSDGVAYQTYTPPTTASTPFYLNGTTIDAGSNKTAGIYRLAALVAANFSTRRSTTYTGASNNDKWWKVFDYNIASNGAGDSFKLQMNEYNTSSGAGTSIVFDIVLKRQDPSVYLTVNVESGVSSFDLANFEVLYNATAKRLSFYYKLTTTYTYTNWLVLNARATTSSDIVWYNSLIGTTLSGQTSDPLTSKTIALNKVNGAFTLPTTAPTTGQVLGYSSAGVSGWIAGSSSGVCGIANSSGVYTYYATLNLAITAATSGQTVDLLTDITETGSVTITTKTGIKINGNGYTYTLSVDDATHAITTGSTLIEMFNIKVVRTGRANNSTGVVISKTSTVSLCTLKCQNVVFENTYGVAVAMNLSAIYGLTVNSYGTGIDTGNSSGYVYNSIVTSSAGIGIYNNDTSEIINCNVTGSTNAINSRFAYVYNTMAKSTSSIAIYATRVVESTGISSSGSAINSYIGYNCVGISTSGIALTGGDFTNSTGISTSGYASSGGTKTNCTLISSSNYASFQENLNNCYLESTTNVPLWSSASKFVNSCTALCLWNNAGGHAINTTSASTGVDIRNCNLSVTNASAYCINAASGSTFKYAVNTYKGSTTAVNATNITQGITNTSDNQGNILI